MLVPIESPHAIPIILTYILPRTVSMLLLIIGQILVFTENTFL